MYKRLWFSLIVIALLAFGSTTLAQQAITIGETVEGQANGEIVNYTVNLESEQSVEINLISEDFDTLIEVLDANQERVGRDDDGGDGLNSRLFFTAPDSGTYTIAVQSFSGGATGSYTLSIEESEIVEELDGGMLSFGETVTIDPSSSLIVTLSFDASAGDVISLAIVSSTGEDLRMNLFDPSGNVVASDDDGGEGLNPQFRRTPLDSDGTYRVEITTFGNSPISDPFTATLETAELINILNTSVEIAPNSDLDSEVLSFEAVAGQDYILTIEAAVTIDDFMSVDINFAGTTSFSSTSLSFYQLKASSATFEATNSGIATITIDVPSETTITVSLSEVK